MNEQDLAVLKAKLPLSASTLARNVPPRGAVDACPELVQRPADAGHAGRESGLSDDPVAALPARKRIRQSAKPLLNKLEAEFKSFVQNDYLHVRCQAVRFRLGNGVWYKPDLVCSGGRTPLTAYEVKGPYAFRGGLENLKVAASLYPEVRWVLVWKEGGLWREQEVLP